MKIVINKKKHCIFANKQFLVPGTNVLESFNSEANDVKMLLSAGEIEVKDSENMDEKAQEEAVAKTNTQEILEKVGKTFKKVDTAKRKKELDDYDKKNKSAMTGASSED